jgi:hypothetical protein
MMPKVLKLAKCEEDKCAAGTAAATRHQPAAATAAVSPVLLMPLPLVWLYA